jgi:hypothetical protein
MIPKSGHRFSDKIMLNESSNDPEKWHRFSEKIVLNERSNDPENACPRT